MNPVEKILGKRIIKDRYGKNVMKTCPYCNNVLTENNYCQNKKCNFYKNQFGEDKIYPKCKHCGERHPSDEYCVR